MYLGLPYIISVENFSSYRQFDFMNYYTTSIRIVAKHYGKPVNIESLRISSQIIKEGAWVLGIAEAVKNLKVKQKMLSQIMRKEQM
jgi:hypothetical protein